MNKILFVLLTGSTLIGLRVVSDSLLLLLFPTIFTIAAIRYIITQIKRDFDDEQHHFSFLLLNHLYSWECFCIISFTSLVYGMILEGTFFCLNYIDIASYLNDPLGLSKKFLFYLFLFGEMWGVVRILKSVLYLSGTSAYFTIFSQKLTFLKKIILFLLILKTGSDPLNEDKLEDEVCSTQTKKLGFFNLLDDEQQVHLEDMRERFLNRYPKRIADFETFRLFCEMLWQKYIYQPFVSSSLIRLIDHTLRRLIT